MKDSIDSLLDEAAAVLDQAMSLAAAIAVDAAERYGVKITTFCKKAAAKAEMPESWNALRQRAERIQKARSKAQDGARARGPAARIEAGKLNETDKTRLRGARKLLSAYAQAKGRISKESEAAVQEALEPVLRASRRLMSVSWPETLDMIADEMASAEDEVSSSLVRATEKALGRVQEELNILKMKTGVRA